MAGAARATRRRRLRRALTKKNSEWMRGGEGEVEKQQQKIIYTCMYVYTIHVHEAMIESAEGNEDKGDCTLGGVRELVQNPDDNEEESHDADATWHVRAL